MTDLEGAVERVKGWAALPDTFEYPSADDVRTILDALASITRERDAYALTMAEARAQVEIVHKALIKTDRDDEDPTQVAIDRASNLLDLDEGQRLLRERDAMREGLKPFAVNPHPSYQDGDSFQTYFKVSDVRRAAALVNGEGVK